MSPVYECEDYVPRNKGCNANNSFLVVPLQEDKEARLEDDFASFKRDREEATTEGQPTAPKRVKLRV